MDITHNMAVANDMLNELKKEYLFLVYISQDEDTTALFETIELNVQGVEELIEKKKEKLKDSFYAKIAHHR
jgi:hypothetical protein